MRSFKSIARVTLALGTLLVGLAIGPAADAATTNCGITWGSADKSVTAAGNTGTVLTGVRSGKDVCFDRVVIDLSGPVVSARIAYVTQVVSDGAGFPIPLRGAGDLQLVVGAPAYDENGHPTFNPAHPSELVNATGYTTLRQVAWAGSFEGQSTIGIGVRARLPMRVFLLSGPGSGSRVVVDIAHNW